jgi:hypothetical protein
LGKELAEPNFKGFGHHPLLAYCDNTGEPLAGMLRKGSAGSNTVADHLEVLGAAITALPPAFRRRLMVTCDGAGASHGLIERLDAYLDTICVDDDAHLVLPPGQPIHYGNHSCDPNLWHTGAYTLTARRDIRPGEELTVDYATQTVAPAFQMPCRCGAPACRLVITGNDWQLPAWRDHYEGHLVPAVAKRIAARQ